ncbi:hypothetical protein C8A03DRAFT_45818 [Achaetomium macrosporum]|uniref:Uncharacterized protein n=1 Tax=Achaetomium macrosporum TaxID=79813 RepID=A0AAN7C6J0_9PEZI|nr:hypothetical protein C8A03DRAFT_45818 [Achaetomium macrosporum]
MSAESRRSSTQVAPRKRCRRANKKVCGKGGMKSTDSPDASMLHNRAEKDVYCLLIDAYRLRVEDNYNLDGEVDADSLYGGQPNGLQGFKRFLRLAGSRSGLLPPLWNAEKQRECEAFGMDDSLAQFQDLRCAVEKSDIIAHYGDQRFPVQLRKFAEAVYRRDPGGQDGAGMRKMMAAIE